MFRTPVQRNVRWSRQHSIFLVVLLLVSAALSAFALLAPLAARASAQALEVGQVVPEDILAPRAITYASQVLTDQARDAAAEDILPVYSAPNASIARTQVNRLRAALTFMETVRADDFATQEQKLADLAALQDIVLSQQSAEDLLALNETGWQSVSQEAIAVLEQLMRSTIREDRLEDTRRSVPALISLAIPEDQADLVSELVTAFAAANSLLSEDLTEAAREEARLEIEPITRRFLTNEVIVESGQVVAEEDIEALQELGLLRPQARWQDQVGAIALVAISFAFMGAYLNIRRDILANRRSILIIAALFLVFLFVARITIPNRAVVPFLFPIAGFSLLVSTLFSAQVGILLTLPLSLLITYALPNSLELTVYYILASMFGVLVLRKAERILSFFWAGAAISAAGALIILAYELPNPSLDVIGLITLLGATLIYGLGAASIGLIMQYLLAQVMGVSTTLQLLELGRPDHPLLQFILRNAPGTYQHSLQIANLAEQAAELIGADALLTRVGALYHDAGKARHPHFFIENQVPGSPNPHDELSPTESAEIIIRHVTDGLELAAKYRLPRRLHDFVAEHHGTMLTRYQYAKAQESTNGDKSVVDKNDFIYPGPKPQSNETGLIMLADGIEARARAERPQGEEELRELVKSVVDQRTSQGQLNDTSLTLHDLETIVESFTTTLRGVYHPRIHYPKIEEEGETFQETQPRQVEETETTH
ncbi:MAG: HDIG domain-containing protein [Chloroflexi bacterium]|nr:MAG: HDIG domain-containing protein [Chloroflexota bacterium]MBL1197236.1 HDIG domain-containing protein [Chloroflexota bacterium]NOH14529.1 HDIG domain-containing protein [Chloroflexota bacterium]